MHGRTEPTWLTDGEVVHLLNARPVAGLAANAATCELRLALDFLAGQRAVLDTLATRRAEALLADHRRVREAARDVGQYSVRPAGGCTGRLRAVAERTMMYNTVYK